MIRRLYEKLLKAVSKPEEAGEYSLGYWQDRVRTAALKLCRMRKGKLLEVGCGEGLFLSKLRPCNGAIEIWGIDNNQGRLDKAKERIKGSKFMYGDATALEFSDNSFDTVVCVNVLFNMPSINEIKKALNEMGRACKKGGSIIFDFKNAANFLVTLKYKLAPYYDRTVKNLPLTTCNIRDIRRVLEEMHFEIINRPYVTFPAGAFTPVILLEARKL